MRPTFEAMAIELNKEARAEAIASIERYFQLNMDERIGNIAASRTFRRSFTRLPSSSRRMPSR